MCFWVRNGAPRHIVPWWHLESRKSLFKEDPGPFDHPEPMKTLHKTATQRPVLGSPQPPWLAIDHTKVPIQETYRAYQPLFWGAAPDLYRPAGLALSSSLNSLNSLSSLTVLLVRLVRFVRLVHTFYARPLTRQSKRPRIVSIPAENRCKPSKRQNEQINCPEILCAWMKQNQLGAAGCRATPRTKRE